ncbi:MAG TPA: type II toxin-antitoxin system Phd/YefM family antitoxin [Phycisphaerae bacterium]|nr:type II toxin-antitoxin system Phd/YefM family antitoxin [Phycisphaerae bacterium]
MKFMTLRDLRTKTAQLRKELASEQEMIVTANGRPFAAIVPVTPDGLEEEVRALRLARFGVLVDRIQARSKAMGLDKMSMEEIDGLIARVRRDRRQRERAAQ